MLAAYAREKALRGLGPLNLVQEINDGNRELPNVTTVERVLERMRPIFANVAERMDRALLNIGRMSPDLGKGVWMVRDATVYAQSNTSRRFIMQALIDRGWLTIVRENDVAPCVQLTSEGWSHVGELERASGGLDSTQAFVAVWFDPQVGDAYENGIEPAVKEAGYEPVRIDNQEFLGKICDEIIAEIRKSRFLVADLTGHRQGVYFEAGFAMGLGMPVIWTCRDDDVKDAHFDARQYNYVVWKTPDELRKKLKHRIEANVPKARAEG